MATLTLAELLAAENQDQIKARILAYLNKNSFPITDWNSGGLMRTDVEMMAATYRDLIGNLIPQIAGGGFLEEALSKWLTLHAKQQYNLDRIAASHTVQTVRLTVSAGNGPHTVAAGDLIFLSTSGRRYINSTGGTLDPNAGSPLGTLEVQVKSESANDSSNPATNYVDPAGTIINLITPLAGVTCTNPAPDFSPVVLSGTGSTGTVTAGRTNSGTPPSPALVKVRIGSSGQVGGGLAFYSLDGAKEIQMGATIPATFDIPATGIRVTFANGATNPSFFKDETFTFSSPGSPVIEQGRDEESDDALIERCRARWPSLAEVPIEDKYILWAKSASPQVTKATVTAHTTIAGRVDVTIAGQVNPLAVGVVSAVQDYINKRAGITDKAVVAAASVVNVDITGQVTVPVGTVDDVKAALDAAWTAYIASIPIGGIVRLSKLAQFIEEAGALDFEDIVIVGANVEAPPTDSSANVNLQLGSTQVAGILQADLPSAALTWFQG